MSKVNALFHIVFCTKFRKLTIPEEHKTDLFRYIWKELDAKKCKLQRINGYKNHLHLLINLNPNVALSDIVRIIKSKSSGWMRTDERYNYFEGWAGEYFAASVSYSHRDAVLEYIKGQEMHHSCNSFDDEIISLVANEGMTLHEDDFTE